MHLGHLVGNGTQGWHRAKGIPLEVQVKSSHYHAYAHPCQGIAYVHDMLIQKLSLIYAHHITPLGKEQDVGRGIHRSGHDTVPLVGYHFLLAIPHIDGRLEYLHPLMRKLCPPQSADEFLCLARKHGAADDLYAPSAHHFSVAGAYVFHYL